MLLQQQQKLTTMTLADDYDAYQQQTHHRLLSSSSDNSESLQSKKVKCCRQAPSVACQTTCEQLFSPQQPSSHRHYYVETGLASSSFPPLDIIEIQGSIGKKQEREAIMHVGNESSVNRHNTLQQVESIRLSHKQIVQHLSKGGCGSPNQRVIFWHCILSSSIPDMHNSHKLHCCSKASTKTNSKVSGDSCKRLCLDVSFAFENLFMTDFFFCTVYFCCRIQAYSTFDSAKFQIFQQSCGNFFSNFAKEDGSAQNVTAVRQDDQNQQLHQCLLDIEQPCAPACSHLSFCKSPFIVAAPPHNSNIDASQRFRGCSRNRDQQAEYEFVSLIRNGKFPNIYSKFSGSSSAVEILPSRTCHNIAKNILCVLSIQPCHPVMFTSHLCMSDCVEFLQTCAINSSLTAFVNKRQPRNQTFSIEVYHEICANLFNVNVKDEQEQACFHLLEHHKAVKVVTTVPKNDNKKTLSSGDDSRARNTLNEFTCALSNQPRANNATSDNNSPCPTDDDGDYLCLPNRLLSPSTSTSSTHFLLSHAKQHDNKHSHAHGQPLSYFQHLSMQQQKTGAGAYRVDCIIGCRAGSDVDAPIVAPEALILILRYQLDQNCYQLCHCAANGRFDSNCRDVNYCEKVIDVDEQSDNSHMMHCRINENQHYFHTQLFSHGNDFCMCHAGEMICSRYTGSAQRKKPLLLLSQQQQQHQQQRPQQRLYGGEERHAVSGLPCNCPNDYTPVCSTTNGKTYANDCLARCASILLPHYQTGRCAVRRERACLSTHRELPENYWCIEVPKSCLTPTPIGEVCEQHEFGKIRGNETRNESFDGSISVCYSFQFLWMTTVPVLRANNLLVRWTGTSLALHASC